MSDEIFSQLRIDEIVLEDTSAIGIKERRIWEHAGQKIRNVNGVLSTGSAAASPWGKKAIYRWEASGAGVLDMPGFDHLEQMVDVLHIVPIDPWTETVAAGVTNHVLQRTPFAGTVKVRDPITFAPVAFTLFGKTLTFAAPTAKPLKLEFRPVLVCVYVDSEKQTDEDDARWSWSLEVAEV